MDFDIPETWTWVELNQLFDFVDYRGKTPHKITEGVFLITASNIKQGFMDYTRKEYISEQEYAERMSRGITKKGDLLFTTEAPMGNAALCDLDICSCGQRIITFQEYEEKTALPALFMYFILSPQFQKQLLDNCTGTTAKGIKADKLKHFRIPLPPLAEQKRIVAKIEELLPYIDRYEKAWNRLEDFNKRFPADMQKSILQLAIQGKLVEQRPEEGTGEELYKQIKEETASLIAAKAIKEEKLQEVIDESEIPFDIPANWTWVRFGNLGRYKKGPFGSALTKGIFVPKSNDTVKVYEQKNAIQKDASLGEYYISKEYFESKMTGFEVQPGDIIVSCAGTIGETFVLPDGIEKGIINQALMRMRLFKPIYVPYFLMFFDVVLKQNAQQNSKGSAIKNIPPFEILKNYLVPLPPLAEQKRIVAKLEELLPLCERLK